MASPKLKKQKLIVKYKLISLIIEILDIQHYQV